MKDDPNIIDSSIQVIEGQLSCIREVVGQGRETPLDEAEIALIRGCLGIIQMAARQAALA